MLTGKDRGLRGKVIVAYPKDDRVLVEGVNRVKKHTKQAQSARGSQTGGIIETEASDPRQQRGVIDPKTGKPGRLGYRVNEDGKKVRVVRSGGQ